MAAATTGSKDELIISPVYPHRGDQETHRVGEALWELVQRAGPWFLNVGAPVPHPTFPSTGVATERIRSGQSIMVDGDAGAHVPRGASVDAP